MKVDIYNTNEKYNIIYADPPWNYRDKRTDKKMSGGVTKHYKTMGIRQIEELGGAIQQIAADDCLLFMWTTFPNLQEGLRAIKAWGFTYKTLGFSWIKTNKKNGQPFFGIGFYTKSNCEVCLIATKGKPGKLKKSNYVSSCIISERREHSRKPDEARERIVQLCGDLPRIELFARQHAEGWDCWGNEC
jgi:N6-adenosine-specific RNA methylase IME4